MGVGGAIAQGIDFRDAPAAAGLVEFVAGEVTQRVGHLHQLAGVGAGAGARVVVEGRGIAQRIRGGHQGVDARVVGVGDDGAAHRVDLGEQAVAAVVGAGRGLAERVGLGQRIAAHVVGPRR